MYLTRKGVAARHAVPEMNVLNQNTISGNIKIQDSKKNKTAVIRILAGDI
jgi:hypothetical protein